MGMTIEQKIKMVAEKANRAVTLQNKAEAQLEVLNQRKDQIIKECRDQLGISPEAIPAEIENLEEELNKKLEQAEALLPEGV